ncbi:T9SS type A sorting domain-containing protein [Seonamhaeicola sp. ML3]|uniref:T9SS type A sorting domain-containing protein n=1 Tax=Seonamhaeicola sp. ML3 TaxID=2937786 RepID=UPI00201055D4|nr:T9SS type A sorting domain-containing protein [Seonamhaeicola sp. ML3]
MKKERLLQFTLSKFWHGVNAFLFVIFLLISQSTLAQTEKGIIKGGEISTKDDTTICLDGNSKPIEVYLIGAEGKLQQWIITDYNNNILGLPENPPFSFEGAGAGICKIWSVSYKDIFNLEVGVNLSDLEGWYELSNAIEVVRNQPDAGTLVGGPFEFYVGDGEADHIDEGAITIDGGGVGANAQWVVTDDQGNILGLPPSPYAVNFNGAGEGTCLVWYLRYDGELSGAAVGNNASDLEGCFDLSNPIEVVRKYPPVSGGTITGGPFEFCVGDEVADNIPEGAITIEGSSGLNSQWVVTDDQGNILGLPPSPYVVNFDGAGAGTCLVWYLRYNGELSGAEVGNNASGLSGDFSLSNPIEVVRNQPDAGTLVGGPFEFYVGDGEADHIDEGAITIDGGGVGANAQWVVTDDQGNILGLPPSPYAVNFDGAGEGTCLVWYLRYDGELSGAAVGNNASDLEGCFNLSNPIEVVRKYPPVSGGTITGGPFEFCVGDEVADNIPEGAITIEGSSGLNSQWVVTDDQGNILGLPPSPYVVNFDGAGAGTCLVWYLRYNGELSGAEVGNNASDLSGDFSLSNPIEVVRNQPDAGTLVGGPFEFYVGDGEADHIDEGAITIDGGGVGANAQWVVTDDQGNILGLPPSPYAVNFDGAGEGTCLVWYLRYDGELSGAAVGNNASDLEGCFNLSNPIEVVRKYPPVSGGTITGGPFEFCVGDEVADNIPEGAITIEGSSGLNSQWVVTDDQGNILGLPPSPYVVNFDGAGAGTCLVWYLRYNGELSGAEVGNNASGLSGDFSLSNPIEVVRNQPDAGTLVGGPFEFYVGDGEADHIDEGAITIDGGGVGANAQWVVTDDQGNILGLPPSPYAVNFDGAGEGTCLVWYLRYDGELSGAAVGNNASDLEGCFNLSNPIEVVRKMRPVDVCEVDGGWLKPGGIYLFCEGDGIEDYATGIKLSKNKGSYSQWVVTDVEGNILGLPSDPAEVNFDGAGPGVCLIWHLSFDGEISGATPGSNAFTGLSGCYDLSNPIPVFRLPSDSGLCEILKYSKGHLLSDNNVPNQANISMFPNPAKHHVKIDLSNSSLENVTIRIHSFSGSEVYNKSVKLSGNRLFDVKVEDFAQGLYLISITDNETRSVRTIKKLLVE